MPEEQFVPSPTQRAQAVWALNGQPCPHWPAIEYLRLDTKTGEKQIVPGAFPATRCNECIADTAATQAGEEVLKNLEEERDGYKLAAEEWERTAADLDGSLRRANMHIKNQDEYIRRLEYELSRGRNENA